MSAPVREDAWRQWIVVCPLRSWKEKHGVFTLSELGSRLGATTITVNAWLLGLQFPRQENMERISKVTGITSKEFRTWFNQRP